MRILQVISHYVPAHRFGGPQRVAHGLGKSLVAAGHEVVVCTTNLADENNDLDVPLNTAVEVDGVKVFYCQTSRLRYWGHSPTLRRRVQVEMANADAVLVHAHYQYANWIGARVARKAGKPYVIFPHSSLRREAINHKSQWIKHAYLALFERRNLQNAMFLAFNAPEEIEDSLYSSRGTVVSNGIAPSEFSDLPPAGAFRKRYPETEGKTFLLFLGRLDVQQKGLDWLVPAFADASKQNPKLHLVLAGPDEEGGRSRVEALAHQHNVRDAITFTGLISGQDKYAALQDADAFVMPSRFEGLSIALLEALYFGLPILMTDRVGLCHEVEAERAGVVVTADAVGVKEGFRTISRERTRAVLRGHGTDLILRKYTWDAIARQLVDQIEARGKVAA